MDSISEEELREYTEVFTLADTDRNGFISQPELMKLFELIGLKMNADELQSILADETDEQSATEISLERFMRIMSKKVNAEYSRDQVKSSFRLFIREKGAEGTISVRDLEQALQLYGHQRMLPNEAKTLCGQLDTSEGRFNFADYINRMMPQ